ncbi:MAG: PEGA domain-containing protein [Myxococcota bacterium]
MRVGAALVAVMVLGCAKKDVTRPEPARLKVVASPDNASVYVDGHYFGRARVLAIEPKALVPGVHLMTVRAEDYFPHDLELDLPPGTTTVDIALRPVPP